MGLLSSRFKSIGYNSFMAKWIFLGVLLLSGCEQAEPVQEAVVKSESVPSSMENTSKEEPPICQNLSIAQCLETIIPALWSREIERDCG